MRKSRKANKGGQEEGEKNFARSPDLLAILEAFIEKHKAGSPTDASVYWIHLNPKQIAHLLSQQAGISLSHGFIKRTLKRMNYKYRKMSKNLPTGQYANRDKQFKIIFTLVAMMSMKTVVISIDCKKKERLGNFYREGKCYSQGVVKVYDHDYEHLSEGKVIPYGIYDLARNEGYICIGSSHETAEFIFDNLLWWWDTYGIHQYADAKNILILCDAGGANSYRHYAFKMQMLLLAKQIGIDIIICHYPPYSSKWNPIEHRLFAHVHQAMKGVVFADYSIVKELIEKTTTDTGLRVVVRMNTKSYQIGSKTSKDQVDFNRIQFHPIIPQLSHRLIA
jgi:hypothetical protein